jgi:hypothetical protein
MKNSNAPKRAIFCNNQVDICLLNYDLIRSGGTYYNSGCISRVQEIENGAGSTVTCVNLMKS